MSWQTASYIGVVLSFVIGTSLFSYRGMVLPTANEKGALSMRDVEARRTHFMRHYALGK